MNFRHLLPGLCTLGCGLVLVLSPGIPIARARAPAPGKPIHDVIAAQITKLGDPEKRKEARDTLISQANPGNAPKVSPAAFFDNYAGELNQQLLPLLNNNTDVAARLNIAIVVAKVAEKANSTRLLPITQALLNDPSDAVVMWGLRSAKSVLPAVIQANIMPQQQAQLLAAIKSKAERNANPALVGLVFDALSLNYPNEKPNPAWTKKVQVTVPEVLNLLEPRVDAFRKEIPPEPRSVETAAAFLIWNSVWSAETPAQKGQTIQLLSNLVSLAAQRAAAANGAEREELGTLAKLVTADIGAAALHASAADPAIKAACDNIVEFYDREVKNVPPNQDLTPMADKLYQLLKAFPAWKDLKPPPKIEGDGAVPPRAPGRAPPAPATAAAG